MNSYMHQTQITAEQLHSFLRDKQAWENAIAMYQGPDPLEHWFNYVRWYESHDPDNKFRETLERCLTLFEHNDFYKQDGRMVRLWLKYIEMQPNQLHFYQVLYQRGVGRQNAEFYISWADHYAALQAVKEANSVYDLAFQAKAQPYADLNHAHSQLLFDRQQQQQARQLDTATHMKVNASAAALQQQQQVSYQQATTSGVPPQPQQQQQQPAAHHAHTAYAATQSHHQQQQPQPDVYQQHQQIHHHPHQQEQQQQQQHLHMQQQQQHLYHQPNNYVTAAPQQQPQQHHHHQHQQQTATAATLPIHAVDANVSAATAAVAYNHAHHAPASIPIEQHLPPATMRQQQQQQEIANHQHHYAEAAAETTAIDSHQQQQQQHMERNNQTLQQQHEGHHSTTTATTATTSSSEVPGIKLPRKFVAYSRCVEMWRPALYLEEPDDPCRQCHYAKSKVYPDGLAGTEYSLEELRAHRFKQLKDAEKVSQQQQLQPQHQQQQHYTEVQTMMSGYYNGQYEEVAKTEYAIVYANANGAAIGPDHENATTNNVVDDATEESQEEDDDPEEVEEDEEEEEEADNDTEDGGVRTNEDPAEDEEAEDENDDDDEDEEQVENETTQKFKYNKTNYEEYHRQQQDGHLTYTHVASQQQQQLYQHERFSMQTVQQDNHNKPIKIKFKKERHMKNGVSGTGGGGYTIENIYQQEIPPSPIAKSHHSFHPYLHNTSTPKSSPAGSKRHKSSKLKRPSHHQQHQLHQHNTIEEEQHHHHHHNNNNNNNNNVNNKFQMAANCNSNSSSVEFCGVGGGGAGGAVTNTNGSTVTNNTMTPVKVKSSANGLIRRRQDQCEAEYNDNANYSFSSAAAFDNSNCSISSAVGRLNFRDITATGGIQAAHNNSTIGAGVGGAVADFSTYQENSYFATQHDHEAKERRLQKALETIEKHLAKPAIDPFNSELCKAFLTKVDFPGSEDEANYKITQTPLPKIANTKSLVLPDGVHFTIDKEVGRGSYGSVYKATDVNSGSIVALKFQKPPNTWEIYICDQVLKRVKSPNVLPGLMDISTAIIAPNASLIATEFSPFGSLLDINNKIRQATTKVMHESLVMHFSSQICQIIHHLHKQKIIHADIKPDNFLLMRVPSTDLHYPSLRLIDFGCAIDMTLFPDADDTKFRKVIQTDGFTCVEMQEGRPWSYETDLFCIAGTVHVMLLGDYMQLQKRCGAWDIKQKLPRYLKKHVWTRFFNEMLNINGGCLPDLHEMREVFDEETAKMDSELQKQIRTLSNILYKR